MPEIFSRVDSTQPLAQVLQMATHSFGLGDIQTYAPILTGYQDCNISLVTSSGRYVVKLFSKEKTKRRIDDVIWAYTTFAKHNVPVPVLCATPDNRYIMEIPGNIHPSFLCVFTYFAGKPLTRGPTTDTDLVTLTCAMATIHTMQHSIGRYYDTLGITNLTEEYKKKSDALSADERARIVPVISAFRKIHLSSLPQSIIHGTYEKENVLKNPDGNLCLLDFGCMDLTASVLDIATFIANFTLYLDTDKRSHVIRVILDTYQSVRPITPDERSALLPLIRSKYAAYAVVMSYHMRVEHDLTKQTQTWLDRGWDGLRTYEKMKRLV